ILSEGTLWRVTEPDWSLSLERVAPGNLAPVKLLLAQEQTFLLDGHQWAHQTEFLVAAHGEADLRLKLPAGARLLALTLDNQPARPRLVSPDSYGVSVAGPPAPHSLRVYWRSLPEAEPLEQPHLGGAYLAGLPGVPLNCRLLVPP